MSDARISKRVVDQIEPTGREYVVWDSDLKGFGVRVRPNGAKSYIVSYRAGTGRKAPSRKLTLGAIGKLTPDQARQEAKKAIAAVAMGKDPVTDKAAGRLSITVEDLSRAFFEEHVKPKRKVATASIYEHALEKHIIPELGRIRVDRLTRPMVASFHLRMKRTPSMANYAIAVIASMFSFAQKQGYVVEGTNPAARIEKFPEQHRQRFLTSDELSRIGDALREAETIGIAWEIDESKPTSKHLPRPENRRTAFGIYPVAAIRLLLLTGCRLREVLNLKWDYVDFGRGIIFLPDSKTGQKPIILNAPALDLLGSLPRVGPFVFPGNNPERPRHDLKRIWSAVCQRSEIVGVRIHDLRHTFASVGAGNGMGLPIVGKLLGHTQPSTTARYAHLDADPVRRASQSIGQTISAALDGRKHPRLHRPEPTE
ncbi:MAG TPA: tyrosine-type recombinase/integrase [Xanthobacteraceae bacterium]